MPDKQPYTVRNGIVVTIIGTTVGGIILLPSVREFFLDLLWWVWSCVLWLGRILVMDCAVPVWLILIGVFLVIAGLFRFIKLFLRKQASKTPSFWNYTEDTLYGVRWRWVWSGNRISDLWCYCPICDAQLVPSFDFVQTTFVCERCPPTNSDRSIEPMGKIVMVRSGNKDFIVGAAGREILRRLRTGEYTTFRS